MTVYKLHDSQFPEYLPQNFSKVNRTDEIGIQRMLTHYRKNLTCVSKRVKSNTGKISVSNRAVKMYNKLTELEIWVLGIQNASQKEQLFYVPSVVTKYFTDQCEVISWFS